MVMTPLMQQNASHTEYTVVDPDQDHSMAVLMDTNATTATMVPIQEHLARLGLCGHSTWNGEQYVISIVGTGIPPTLRHDLGTFPGVQRITPLSRMHKLGSREFHPDTTVVHVRGVPIGGPGCVVMAGPCTVEGEAQIVSIAQAVRAAGATMLRGGAFKPRTSPYSFRGYGEDGLKMLATARAETGLPIVTEVMVPHDVELVARYADMLQIGARNMQNFQLLEEAGRTGMPVLLKRGLSATIDEWLCSAEYILAQGNRHVVLCERGIRTFETATRNTMDINAIVLAKRRCHMPVIADPSHGTGKWHMVGPVAMAALAAGADGLMIEVHPNPDTARSDGAQSLTIENFAAAMQRCRAVAAAVDRSMLNHPAGAVAS